MDFGWLDNLNFEVILKIILRIFWIIVKFPIEIYNKLPTPVQIAIKIFLVIFGIIIIIAVWINREEWLHVRY